jgi:hypothetical protein
MYRHGGALVCCYLPQIVDPVTMVGMIVRDDNAIDGAHIGQQQLPPQVRAAIDEQLLPIAFDQD